MLDELSSSHSSTSKDKAQQASANNFAASTGEMQQQVGSTSLAMEQHHKCH
jgi:hypothetical protein